MSMKHTPGPWKFVTDFRCGDGSLAPGVMSEAAGCAVAWPHGRSDVEEIANGRLIALAPQMLAACEYMLKHGFERKWDGDERAFSMLQDIVKAIGEAS